MATTTINYGFIKSELEDSPPDISVTNANWDILDEELKSHMNEIDTASNLISSMLYAERVNGRDLNNILTEGFYSVSSGTTNAPITSGGSLLVFPWVASTTDGATGSAETVVTQMFISITSVVRVFTRTNTNGTSSGWTAWRESVTMDNGSLTSSLVIGSDTTTVYVPFIAKRLFSGSIYQAGYGCGGNAAVMQLVKNDSEIYVLRMYDDYRLQLHDVINSTYKRIDKIHGSGAPEGVVTAFPGTTYFRTDGGTNTTEYIKQTGTGNTGWKAVNSL